MDSPSVLKKITADDFVKLLKWDPSIVSVIDISRFIYINNWGYEVISIDNVLVDGSVVINGGKFEKRIEIKNCIFNNELRIDGGIFNKWIRIYNGIFKAVSIDGGVFKEGMRVSGGCFEEAFNVRGGQFEKWLRIFGGIFTSDLNIEGGEFHKPIQVKQSKSDVTLSIKTFNVNMLVQCRLEIENVTIIALNLYNEIGSSGFVKIQDSEIRNIYVNLDNLGHIGFFNVKAPNYQFNSSCIEEDEEVDSSVCHLDCTTSHNNESTLSFVNSQLGDVYFKNFNFESYDKIIVINSRLENIRQFGIIFPVNSDRVFSSKNKEKDLQALRELYTDLQNAAAKNSDRLLRHVYYAEQLEIYRKQLIHKRKYLMAVPLYAAKISSSYGLSWLRGLVFTVSSTFVFYLLYLIFHQQISFGLNHFTLENTLFFTSKFVEFLFPAHKPELIANPGSVSILLDYAGRVCSGFGIYQTIAAFRRFAMRG